MSYNVRSVTLASVWVLWRITRNHLLSYLVVMAFFYLFSFLFHHFSLFSIVSQLPSTYTWPDIVTRNQKDHKKAWYSGSTQDSYKICLREDKQFDGLHKNIKIVITSPIKMNQIVFYCYLSNGK